MGGGAALNVRKVWVPLQYKNTPALPVLPDCGETVPVHYIIIYRPSKQVHFVNVPATAFYKQYTINQQPSPRPPLVGVFRVLA